MKYFNIKKTEDVIFDTYNGITLPKYYSDRCDTYFAVRNTVLMTDFSHHAIVNVSGDDAWRLLNYFISADLSTIRDEQLLYTLILNNNGNIISDLYIICDNESYFLICEWMNSEQLCRLINECIIDKAHCGEQYLIHQVMPLTPQWRMICVEGPYSWEILSEIFGMDIIGLPFHEFMYIDNDILIMRVGKHGEYCYYIIGDEEKLSKIWESISQLSEKYDLIIGGVGYLKNIRIENPCWEPEVYNVFSRCPIELQMQWAIGYDKDEFIGQDEIKKRSDIGVEQQIVGARIKGIGENIEINIGDPVFYQQQNIGVVIDCGLSYSLNDYIARVLLKYEFAYVDIDDYVIRTKNGDVSFITVSIPFINNLSMKISPTEDSYLNKNRDK